MTGRNPSCRKRRCLLLLCATTNTGVDLDFFKFLMDPLNIKIRVRVMMGIYYSDILKFVIGRAVFSKYDRKF